MLSGYFSAIRTRQPSARDMGTSRYLLSSRETVVASSAEIFQEFLFYRQVFRPAKDAREIGHP